MKAHKVKKFKPVNPATVLIVKQLLLGLLLFSIVGLLITGTWYGTRLQTFTISKVSILSDTTIKQEKVAALVNETLDGSYLRLIPRRFVYFYPEAEILNALDSIERIKDVELNMLSNQELQVSFSEYDPEGLWCQFDEQQPCYFLDSTGYAFGVAPKLSGSSFVRYYSLAKDPLRGDRPFSPEDYQLTKDFIARLNEIDWYVTKVEIDAVRDVFYTLSPQSELKVSMSESPEKVFSYLQSLLQSDEYKHLSPGNFQYIDLRFGTKLFVNETPIITKAATTTEASTTASTTNLE